MEVELLAEVLDAGHWTDITRHDIRDGKLYTWWSYRARDWNASDRGRRLDHIWASPDLVGDENSSKVLRGARGWSDRRTTRLFLRHLKFDPYWQFRSQQPYSNLARRRIGKSQHACNRQQKCRHRADRQRLLKVRKRNSLPKSSNQVANGQLSLISPRHGADLASSWAPLWKRRLRARLERYG